MLLRDREVRNRSSVAARVLVSPSCHPTPRRNQRYMQMVQSALPLRAEPVAESIQTSRLRDQRFEASEKKGWVLF